MNIQEEILKRLDVQYSYELAKRMEQFRTNEVLGYRTAGSRAEHETGEMLKEEMQRIGLSNVTKDAITVDKWEFKKAVLRFHDAEGTLVETQLGAYQTNFVTDGFESYALCYVGKGTARDYENIDVTGKLVLVDINQRDEWWINYPVYQAHLKGAKAVIAVQNGGYGEVDEEALNAQDIAGPEDAPAFSISQKDAAVIKAMLEAETHQDNRMQQDTDVQFCSQIQVELDADTRVYRNEKTYNITGCIPGKHPDRIVLLSAHYDSYFDGFQDDNTAVAMMFGIARAYIEIGREYGYQPNNTILICAMAAEEWGVADSNFDWSTGAYEQVFTAHPEWPGKVIADLNFELPALAHGSRARIRSCFEYMRFLNEFLLDIPNLTQAYPEETRVIAPIETWSDDFSMAISGIPSMVNDFTGGSFMETHYHSQFDNDAYYDEQVYRLHHELYALLIEAFDRTAIAPLCFTQVFKHAYDSIDDDNDFLSAGLKKKATYLMDLLFTARDKSGADYDEIRRINNTYNLLLGEGKEAEAEALFADCREKEQEQLAHFKLEQDSFVRIDWYGNVLYAHEILLQELRLIDGTIRNLKKSNISSALRKLYQLDNNAYAFAFDREVYDHFNDYVYNQPRERLKWGYGRLMEHRNMYEIVTSLLHKKESGDQDYAQELKELEELFIERSNYLERTMDEMYRMVTNQFIL